MGCGDADVGRRNRKMAPRWPSHTRLVSVFVSMQAGLGWSREVRASSRALALLTFTKSTIHGSSPTTRRNTYEVRRKGTIDDTTTEFFISYVVSGRLILSLVSLVQRYFHNFSRSNDPMA